MLFQGLVVPLTTVIIQIILLPTVLCKYQSNKINCDEPFEFCPNKRPSNQPKSCSRNGGYPDDLTYNNAAYADYSQYRAAIALKPCFNKELNDMGFENEEDFRIIDLYTDNNFKRIPNLDNEQFSTASERYGRYKRDFVNSDQRGVDAVAVVYEDPESRKALIEYLRYVDLQINFHSVGVFYTIARGFNGLLLISI